MIRAGDSGGPEGRGGASDGAARIDLWWLPVGAGGHLTAHTSHWWELIQARREARQPQQLFHTAIEVTLDATRYVIEMTPAWGSGTASRGVVAHGPVGSVALGWARLFRYEVRCWRDDVLPDRQYAVTSPVGLSTTAAEAAALLSRVTAVPRLTWGRDEIGAGDMWNSNSLIAWLLQTSRIDASLIVPPQGGRAPGWRAGIVAAASGSGRS